MLGSGLTKLGCQGLPLFEFVRRGASPIAKMGERNRK